MESKWERQWRNGQKQRLARFMASNDYRELGSTFVQDRWGLPATGCQNVEEFQRIVVKWQSELYPSRVSQRAHAEASVGYWINMLPRIFPGVAASVEGESPEQWSTEEGEQEEKPGDLERTSFLRCWQRCEAAGLKYGISGYLVLRSLFLPEDTETLMDIVDPTHSILYRLRPNFTLYRDSPAARMLFRMAETSGVVAEAVKHIEFHETEIGPLLTTVGPQFRSGYSLFTVEMEFPPQTASELVRRAKVKAGEEARVLAELLGFELPERERPVPNLDAYVEVYELSKEPGWSVEQALNEIYKRHGHQLALEPRTAYRVIGRMRRILGEEPKRNEWLSTERQPDS